MWPTRAAPALILCYHRVASGVADPYYLCVSPDHFAQHLKVLTQRLDPVTLDDLLRPSRRPRVAITFDDGYADNLLNAVPIARSLGVPITVYVTSGLIDDRDGFWWDRLARLVAHPGEHPVEAEVTIGNETVHVPLGVPEQVNSTIHELQAKLKPRSLEEITHVLDQLADAVGAMPPAAADRPLTTDELGQLADEPGVTIGGHTVVHTLLRGTSRSHQEEAIGRSKHDLETRLKRPVRHFAYPFGGTDSFDETSVEVIRDFGFATATTTLAGSVRATSDPLQLHRRLVMNWNHSRFLVQLVRWGFL